MPIKSTGDLTLSVGKSDEKLEVVGLGLLNIEGLPVYRDSVGGIGTPTGDEERTKISLETTNLLLMINGYAGGKGLVEAREYALQLPATYA